MKKSLYLTETKHSLVYKSLILLFFFPSITSICFSGGGFTFVDFLGLSALEQKCTGQNCCIIVSGLFWERS